MVYQPLSAIFAPLLRCFLFLLVRRAVLCPGIGIQTSGNLGTRCFWLNRFSVLLVAQNFFVLGLLPVTFCLAGLQGFTLGRMLSILCCLVSTALQLLLRPLLPLSVLDLVFLALQISEHLAATDRYLVLAISDRKAVHAGGILHIKFCGLLLTHRPNSSKLFVQWVRPRRCCILSPDRCNPHEADRRKDALRTGHVSPVSTSRRSSDRYSWDCISLSRDTVRGNSCSIGPSVYKSIGELWADITSLTRRS